MIDLSHNNGAVDFGALYKFGQRRVYLKVTEGVDFVDPAYVGYAAAAHRFGFKVGGYHFAQPRVNKAIDEARFFVKHLGPIHPNDLRPVLDCEVPGTESSATGKWIVAFANEVYKLTHVRIVLYSFASYIDACNLPAAWAREHPLWLAAYGSNDGREHPFVTPQPYAKVAAHQYADNVQFAGHLFGIDISHVVNPAELNVH